MYSKTGKGIAIVYIKVSLLLFNCMFVFNSAMATEINKLETKQVDFTALPEQCVTLRQGRACFATVELQWQSALKQNFCLYQEGKEQQLGCWQNNNKVQIKVEFESNKSIKYQLRTVSDNKIIAETQVEVSWQHKKTSRKRRWRLF
jgi:hypothetical protein